jgi:hypothetical protein
MSLEVMLRCIATGEAEDRPDLLISMEELTDLVDYRRIAQARAGLAIKRAARAQIRLG